MKNRLAALTSTVSILFSILACGGGGEPAAGKIETRTPSIDQTEAKLQPRGDRMLGIDVNEGDHGDFDDAFERVLDVGVDFVSLTIYWDDFETAPSTYAPEINWLKIANSYYSAAGLDLALVVAPIDTNVLRTPGDLRGLAFDDPEMIARFQSFLEYVSTQLPDIELLSISIGNEVDAYLGNDQALWDQYQIFYSETIDHIHSTAPDWRVGVKSMYPGLVGGQRDRLQALNSKSDVILVTYYPLEADFSVRPPGTVFTDFAQITSLYPDRPIHFTEVGYPSSTRLGSSEEAQAAFIRNSFAAWDDLAGSISVINFTWLHDISPAQVDFYAEYYGTHDANFLAYLGSLGLVHADGTEKAAFLTLEHAAAERGW